MGTIRYQVSAVVDGKETKLSEKVELTEPLGAGKIDNKDPHIVYTGAWGDWDLSLIHIYTDEYLDIVEKDHDRHVHGEDMLHVIR